MRRLLLKNSISGIILVLLNSILVFITIPIFIRNLGIEKYGAFSIISIVGNLNLLSSLGLNTALVKFLAEQGKITESDNDIIVTFFLLFIIYLPVIVIVIYFKQFIILKILSIPVDLQAESETLLIFMVVANMILLTGQTFVSILNSMQKIYLTNILQLFYSFTYWIGLIIALIFSKSLAILGFIILASTIVWLGLHIYFFAKNWPQISIFNLKGNFKRVAKKQIAYSSKIYFSGIISFMFEPLMKVIISKFFGLTVVGYYDIAIKVRNQLWALISKLFYPLYPLIAELTDHEKIRLLVHDLTQKSFLLIIPLLSCILICTKPISELWLGSNANVLLVHAILFITFAYMIGITVQPIYHYLIAKDLAGKTIILQLNNVVVNFLILIATINLLGFYSIILSQCTAILSSFLLCLHYQNKYLKSKLFASLKEAIKVLSIFLISTFTGYIFSFYIINENILKIILLPVVIFSTSIVLTRWYKLITTSDVKRYLGDANIVARLIKNLVVSVN